MIILRNFSINDFRGLGSRAKEFLSRNRKELAKRLLKRRDEIKKISDPIKRNEAIESALSVNKANKNVARRGAEIVDEIWKH